jgi:hypothetical protein
MANGKYNTTGTLKGEPPSSNKPAEAANPELSAVDALQLLLDLAGLIPGAGAIPDVINAAISFIRGDFIGGALSLFSAVPAVGDAAGLAKIIKNSDKYVQAIKVVEQNVLPKLPNFIRKPLKEFIEKAKAKMDELTGTKPKPETKPEQNKPNQKEDNAQSKGKPKPDCGQIGVYRDKKKFDNDGTNWDHVPSGRALEQAAENKLKEMKGPNGKSVWSNLTPAQRTTVLNSARNDAYTINVPSDVHQTASPTWGSRNKPLYGSDAGSLKEAMRRDMDEIEKHMQNTDHPCRKNYLAARRAMSRIDPDKHLNEVIQKTLQGFK